MFIVSGTASQASMRRWIGCLGLLLMAASGWAQSSIETEKIEALLDFIESSRVVFLRNGGEHSGPEAAKHLRSKWKRAGDQVKTARQFIDGLASKSSMSGKPYRVRFLDGTEREVGPWLDEALAKLEADGSGTVQPAISGTDPQPEDPTATGNGSNPAAADPNAAAAGSIPGAADPGKPAAEGKSGTAVAAKTVAIQDVLQRIRSSDLEFHRVESDEVEVYTGERMARHVSWKYLLDGQPKVDANRFIRRYCTRSLFHQTEYLVRGKDGQKVKLAVWLRQELGLATEDAP